MSSLNPYASSYVPLSKRTKENEIKSFKITPGDSEFYDMTASTKAFAESPEVVRQDSGTEVEMDLAYLAVMFPGVSDQSLSYVYHASGGDMEVSVDMLNQLELPAELSHQLPDTLDIGNLAAEYGSPAEGTSAILKRTISGEASASSSSVVLK